MNTIDNQPFAVWRGGAFMTPPSPLGFSVLPSAGGGLQVSRLVGLPVVTGRIYWHVACSPGPETALFAANHDADLLIGHAPDFEFVPLPSIGPFRKFTSVAYAGGRYWIGGFTGEGLATAVWTYDAERQEFTDSGLIADMAKQGVDIGWVPFVAGDKERLVVLHQASTLCILGEDRTVLRRYELQQGDLVGPSPEGLVLMHCVSGQPLRLERFDRSGDPRLVMKAPAPAEEIKGFCLLDGERLVVLNSDRNLMQWRAKTEEWLAVEIDHAAILWEAYSEAAARRLSGEEEERE